VSHPQQRAGVVTGITAYVLWGLLTIYWKQLSEFEAFELIGWRIATAAAAMVVIISVTRRWHRLDAVRTDRRLLARMATAAVLLTVNWTAYVWAVVHDHVLETALGYFVAPIGTVLVGVVVLKEHLRPAQRISLVFAVASVVVLAVSYGEVPWLALVIAGSWIVYGYMKKQVPLAPPESMATESFLLAIPAVVLAWAYAGEPTSVPNTASTWEFALVLSTGLATVAPLMLFSHAAQRVPLSMIGPMQYIVPSMNFLIGWLLYHEDLPPARLVGFALVWIGLVVLTVDSARRARRSRNA
jgi:chloramphenicol-sensitive protein RarD